MPRRRRIPPNPNALDPADPEMRVIRKYKMGDGTTRTEVDPDYERRYREMLMATNSEREFPSWRRDPTYNLRKR